jgi:hypothetical protein
MNTMKTIEWKKTKKRCGFIHFCVPPAGKPHKIIIIQPSKLIKHTNIHTDMSS